MSVLHEGIQIDGAEDESTSIQDVYTIGFQSGIDIEPTIPSDEISGL